MPDESTKTITSSTGGTSIAEPVTMWQDAIAPELKEKLFTGGRFTKDENPNNLAKSYLELEKKSSGIEKLVEIPDDKTPPEKRNEFFKKLGRPDAPDKYEIKRPKLPEGMSYDEGLEKEIRQFAFEEGISGKTLAKLADKFNDYQIKSFENLANTNVKLNEERWTNLKVKWGENRTKENIEYAKRAFDEFAPEELKKLMTRDDVIADPLLVEMYQDIWRRTAEDKLVKGEGGELKEEEYKPQYPDSPEMYRHGEDDESKKARAWFEKNKGFKY